MKALCTILCAVILSTACRERPVLLLVMDARQRTTDALAQLAKASDASNRAVMAEADEQSATFASEADQAKKALAQDVEALRVLLEGAGFEPEQQRVAEFDQAYATYRSVDDQMLALAVENTNRKAQELSHRAAASAADAFAESLDQLRPMRGREWQLEAHKARAIAEVQRILALQAPHIAEANDAAMDAIDGRIREADARARRALEALRGIADSPSSVDTPVQQLARFSEMNIEILKLSRRNTDVRSLALALNEKGKQFVNCERALVALSAELEQRGSFGAR